LAPRAGLEPATLRL